MARRNTTAASMAAECKVKFTEGLGNRRMTRGLMTKLVEQYKTKGFQKRIDQIEADNRLSPATAKTVAQHWDAERRNVLRVAKHLSRIAVILSGNSDVDDDRLVAASKAVRKSKVCQAANPAGGGLWCDFDLSF